MKAPIAQRRVTGARRTARRRRPRGLGAALRRPLALLYRQSGKARTTAPAAVRAADGRAVPLAPRLQIALHLSLTLIEQQRALQVSAASYHAAPAMPAATAAAPERNATSGRFTFAAHFTRVERAYRTPAGARIGSPPSLDRTGARGNEGHVGRHGTLLHAKSGFPKIALPSGGGPGHGFGGPASPASAAPPWPLRREAGVTAAAAAVRDLPGHGRLPAGSRGSRSQDRFIRRGSDDSPPSRSGASGEANVRSTIGRPRAERHGERMPPVHAERPGGANGTALRQSAAGPAARPSQRPGRLFSRRITRRLPGGTALEPVGRLGPPGAADRLATLRGETAAPSTAPPLYVAERSGGRAAASASLGSAWAPPPLDYRSAATPTAPPLPAEARPAAAAVPSAAFPDLEAVSRDVISRIEKRLRVERERRGRS